MGSPRVYCPNSESRDIVSPVMRFMRYRVDAQFDTLGTRKKFNKIEELKGFQ